MLAAQIFDGLSGEVCAFDRSIQLGRVTSVVLSVVNFHGARIDVGLEGVVSVGKCGEFKRHRSEIEGFFGMRI